MINPISFPNTDLVLEMSVHSH